DKHDVVRTGRLIKRERRIHVANVEGDWIRPLVEPVIGDQRALNTAGRGSSATWSRVGRAAEIVDQRVGPVAGELAGDTEPRPAGIDATVEILNRRELGRGVVIEIITHVEVQSSGQID